MIKKSFVWTFSELQERLDSYIKSWYEVIDVRYVSYLIDVASFVQDNEIRVFVLELKEPNVPTDKKD